MFNQIIADFIEKQIPDTWHYDYYDPENCIIFSTPRNIHVRFIFNMDFLVEKDEIFVIKYNDPDLLFNIKMFIYKIEGK